MDNRPEFNRKWESLLLAARHGDKEAHKALEASYPVLPTGTAYRPFDSRTCQHCGLKHS